MNWIVTVGQWLNAPHPFNGWAATELAILPIWIILHQHRNR